MSREGKQAILKQVEKTIYQLSKKFAKIETCIVHIEQTNEEAIYNLKIQKVQIVL